MILTEKEIKDIILTNPHKALIQAGRKYNTDMRKHFYGHNLASSLSVIEGFEKPAIQTLRAKYSKSNKDLFSRLSRPIDKVFSARGGSVYYNLPETQEKTARAMAMDIKGGASIKKWIQNTWKAHYLDDPYGIIFMEIADKDQALKLKAKGKSFVYPTYKSIQSIYDYKPNGENLEYVVFTVDTHEKAEAGYKPEDAIYRVVDDAMDYFVQLKDNAVTIIKEQSFPNYFTYVPGIINSDISDPNVSHGRLSLFEEIRELAEMFWLKGSIKITHEFFHAYPKYWEYADSCKTCSGTGWLDSAICPTCKGSKKSTMTSVSDAKVIAWPQSKEDPVVTPNVAGYVSPDKVYYDIATSDLSMLEDLMNYTLWGSSNSQKTSGMSTDSSGPKTATEITNEIKPQSDRLEPISECAETRHKFILDAMIRTNISAVYPGSSVNYGKRFMIESPDAIWEKYIKAKADGAAYSILDDLLMEYYEAKFNSDPVKLAIQNKLMRVEPFVHNTVDEIKEWPVNPVDKLVKAYYSEWQSSVSEGELISSDTKSLNEKLIAYSIEKSANNSLQNNSTPLAVKLGVGGTQALQLILSDQSINEESKRNSLVILFGVSEADAAKMVVKSATPPEPKPLPV